MVDRKTLSASHIRYLLTMKKLGESGGGGIRLTDIAASLRLSKPSVHNMMDTFSAMGLVTRESYGVCRFTELGESEAKRYSRYYDSVSEFLSGCFPEETDIRRAVCMLLSEIPDEKLEYLCGTRETTGSRQRSG